MKKEMLINVLQPEESRIAILEDGVLEELYVERTGQENLVGNIYKGRIVNIEPSIQAAFVDFGVGRNGFLHVSDVEPQYFHSLIEGNGKGQEDKGQEDKGQEEDEHDDPREEPDAGEARPHSGRRPDMRRSMARGMRSKPPIQQIFKRGQEVLVQVIKEGIGTKGPTLSTYLSIPGRYLVLMPGLNRVGVSRKIDDEQQRRQLRDILNELNPPKGLGFIVRTAGLDRSKKDLSRDLAYLTRLWKVVSRRIAKSRAPTPIYQESDMITRTIRDIFTGDIDEILVDEPQAFERAREFLQITMPRYEPRLKAYEDKEPLFHKYHLEEEIARIQQRHVPLPNGGSIVIEATEALVAIDVNSGNFRADNNAEETAFRMNLAAAKEIARQLRLRDLGGVIVNDFIDMREERHRREVERAMRDAVKRDRARTKILKISAFGIIEMTRQRIRPSLKRSVYEDCPACHGTGQVKTAESMSIDVMRLLQLGAHHPDIARINVAVHTSVASYLNNRKRRDVTRLEEEGHKSITIRGLDNVSPEHLAFECLDASGAECKVLPPVPALRPRQHGRDRRPAAAAPPGAAPPGAAPPGAAPPPAGPEGRPARSGRRRGGRGRGRGRRGAAPPGPPRDADTVRSEELEARYDETPTESGGIESDVGALEDSGPSGDNGPPLYEQDEHDEHDHDASARSDESCTPFLKTEPDSTESPRETSST